jgi:hypothetical protein
MNREVAGAVPEKFVPALLRQPSPPVHVRSDRPVELVAANERIELMTNNS